MNWQVILTRQAQKDAKKIALANLKPQVILWTDFVGSTILIRRIISLYPPYNELP